MSKMYVLVENNFEYNDEIYYNHGSGGDPIKVFHDKKLADVYCRQKNIERLKNTNIGQYCYDLYDIDKGGLIDLLKNSGLSTDDFCEIHLINLTDEQLEQLYQLTTLRFYEVVEVDDILPPDLIETAVEDAAN